MISAVKPQDVELSIVGEYALIGIAKSEMLFNPQENIVRDLDDSMFQFEFWAFTPQTTIEKRPNKR